MIADYEAKFSTPLAAARRGYADRIIHPEDTRKELVAALESLKNKQQSLPLKKHSNLPL